MSFGENVRGVWVLDEIINVWIGIVIGNGIDGISYFNSYLFFEI